MWDDETQNPAREKKPFVRVGSTPCCSTTRWYPLVPIGHPLVCTASPNKGGFIQMSRHQLDGHGGVLKRETCGQGKGGIATHVKKVRCI